MNFLLPIIRLINPLKLKGIRTLRGKNQAIQLFHLLHSGQVKSDEEARRFFFPDNPHGGVYLSVMKRELRERLINTLLCMPPAESDSPVFKAYQQCTKELAVIKQLEARGARQAAVALTHRSVKTALEFQFTEQIVTLAQLLYMHYAGLDPDPKQKNHWKEITETYRGIYQVEWQLERLYNEITFQQATSKSAEQFEGMEAAIIETETLMQAHPTAYRVHLLGYNILTRLFILINDHPDVIRTCREAIAFFRTLDYPVTETTVLSFVYKMIPSYIQLEQYQSAREATGEALKLVREGTNNWFAISYYQIILAFYSGDFQQALVIVTQIKKHQIPFSALREQLLIAEAYVAFFLHAGYIDGELPSFRPGKFLNEVPTFSRDKRGMNVNILILQTLFLLQGRRWDQIIDRTEALAMYTHRYLRRDENFRSNCFIRLLLLLPKNSFHPAAVDRKAAPILAKLNSASLQGDYDVEIVPYPTLWEVVMKLLEAGV